MPRAAHAMLDPSLLVSLCDLAADPGYFTGLHQRLAQRGLGAAVRAHDTPALFGWLVEGLSYQGISDAALTFMDRHGRAEWQDLARGRLWCTIRVVGAERSLDALSGDAL